jgi:hypothetical protein
VRNRFFIQGERDKEAAKPYLYQPLPEGARLMGLVNFGAGRRYAVCHLDGKLLVCTADGWLGASFEVRKAFGWVPEKTYE